MQLKLLCLFIVLCFINFAYVDGLKANDTGVCAVTRSVKKTQRRVYIVKYKCGKKICTTRRNKIKDYTVTQNDILCCKGWMYSSALDACSPLCSRGCISGRCTAPDICTCLHGYENDNNTCKPKCDFCENGHCTAPNDCECFDGYAKSDGVCKPLCVNVTSKMCKCVIGYKNDSASCYTPCREDCLVCDLKGNCKRKNDCGSNEVECCEGYHWIQDEHTKEEFCEPSCKPSCRIYEKCVGYNQCKCMPPYELRKGTCLPPIMCETPCVNGKCTDYNTCTCNTGYIPKNATYCKPECRNSCINSFCTAPDRCDCMHGYTRKNQWECTPDCDKCDNGECIGPNICKCKYGYLKQGDKCVPICKGNCLHGHCSKPGECVCDAGYANDATDKLTCRPVCDPGCVNASCVSPKRCKCSLGYKPTRNVSVCEPKCDYCTNGDCIGPNVCSCHDGYVMIGSKCKPVCSRTCVNGFCSEPDKCTCLAKYIKDDSDKFNCKPECAGCENGNCTSPGRCSCNEGYQRRNGTCEPICLLPCVNGYCKSPNECVCPDGYKMNYTLDSAVCYKPCLSPCDNGICNINGECICTYGYSNETGCLEKNNETIDCKSCKANCIDDMCKCPDGRPCELLLQADVKAPTTGLAGLELTWILGACIGLLLIVFVIAIMAQMWRKRPNAKTTYDEGNRNGSVGFTAPGTLIFSDKKSDDDDDDRYNSFDKEYDDEDKNEQTSEELLYGDIKYEDENL